MSPTHGTESVGHGNPFTPDGVVPVERFVGRKHELQVLLAYLENMLSVSLVGEARIGKSSLLRYLEARLPALLRESGRYLPIYLSMDAQRSQATFCKAILERLLPQMPPGTGQEHDWRALEQRLKSGQAIALNKTAQTVESAARAGLRVVLLLDEFKDLLERAGEFDDVFRGVLRSLYTNRHVALITATRQPLVEIAGLSAYFANGVSQQVLMKLMVHAEAEQLVRQPHDRSFSAAEVRLALEAGRLHPLRLQCAGFWLYHWKGQPPGPIYDSNGTLRNAAARILNREVQRIYDQAMEFSRPHPAYTGSRRRRWLARGNTLITRLGDAIDAIQARFYAVLLLIACVVACGLLLLYALKLLTFDQLKDGLRRLIGGS